MSVPTKIQAQYTKKLIFTQNKCQEERDQFVTPKINEGLFLTSVLQKKTFKNRSQLKLCQSFIQTQSDDISSSERYEFSSISQQTSINSNPFGQNQTGSAWKDQLGEYRKEICDYIAAREDIVTISPNYAKNPNRITKSIRDEVVRYLFIRHLKLKLQRTTLHLSVLYLDMFFSRQPFEIKYDRLITIAQSCMLIAMKLEQVRYPYFKHWVSHKSKRKEVLKMQADILKVIDYQLAHYTVVHHISCILEERGKEDTEKIVDMIADLSLFDLPVRLLKPSKVALAIVRCLNNEACQDQQIVLSIKSMIDRNSENMHWLCQNKYEHFLENC